MTLLHTPSKIQPSEILIVKKLIKTDGNLGPIYNFVTNSSKNLMNLTAWVGFLPFLSKKKFVDFLNSQAYLHVSSTVVIQTNSKAADQCL